MYNLDWNKILRHYLSTWFGPVRVAWLSSLISPFYTLSDAMFITFRSEVIELARYSRQKIILQSILNKAFNTGNKTDIYIVNSDRFVEPTYLFNEVEGYDPEYLFNEGDGAAVYLYNEAEFAQAYDFIVYVPEAIYTTNLTRLKGLIDLYKAAGPNYAIISY